MTYALANFEPSYILHGAGAFCLVAALVAGVRLRDQDGWRRVVGVVGILLVLLMGPGLMYIGHSANHVLLRIDQRGVEIDTVFYGGVINDSMLHIEQARIVNPSGADAELRPTRRTNGVGLPSLKLGWFQLANGRRAFLAVSDLDRAVYIPGNESYDLLVSPEDPERFVADLQAGG